MASQLPIRREIAPFRDEVRCLFSFRNIPGFSIQVRNRWSIAPGVGSWEGRKLVR
jgi:hypothetical protein